LAKLKNDFERIVAYIEEIRVAPFWTLLLTPARSDGICHGVPALGWWQVAYQSTLQLP
jgi:hypothetical protein